MDIVERLTELRDLMKQDIDKSVLQDAINEIEHARFKIESWENFHKLMESNWERERELLQEKLKKSQDDMKWWITQTEMRGITFARVKLEGD